MFKSQRYVDALPRIVKSYNSNVHKSTGQAPQDLLTDKTLWTAAVKKQKEAGEKRVKKTKATLAVGDNVRLSLRKAKGALGHVGSADQWTKRIYKIASILKSRGAPRYKLTGFDKLVYSDRLQKVRDVHRKVKYTDRPKLSAMDPEAKARTGIFGLVAPKPKMKLGKKRKKKKNVPP